VEWIFKWQCVRRKAPAAMATLDLIRADVFQWRRNRHKLTD
jgi:hypothetical protein